MSLDNRRIRGVYFTGMLTHGQSEFFVQYIDPDSHTVRSNYPDFVFEVRRALGDRRGEARGPTGVSGGTGQEGVEQMASASRMTYRIIGGTTLQPPSIRCSSRTLSDAASALRGTVDGS